MMKIFTIIFVLLTFSFFSCENVNAYGLRVDKDYRFTTQQDRNQRIYSNKKFLENTGIFTEAHSTYKADFKPYKKDENYKANLNYLKYAKPLLKSGYQVRGNYYLMADKILANYSVTYSEHPEIEYVYDMFGNLYQVIIQSGDSSALPYFKAVYSFNGYLQKVRLFSADGYEYIFLANGDLQGVVINNNLYNRVGRPVKVWLL